MHDWLLNSPIMRLFVIIALGYVLGEIKFPGGFRLGVAGVLFVGLACGAWTPSMELPPEIQALGLVLFVYCIGLQAAPGFFKRQMQACCHRAVWCWRLGARTKSKWPSRCWAAPVW